MKNKEIRKNLKNLKNFIGKNAEGQVRIEFFILFLIKTV